MWHLIAHFDDKRYDLGAVMFGDAMFNRLLNTYVANFGPDVTYNKFYIFSGDSDPPKSQLDFIKDYKTKHFMNAQLETPDVSARFDDEGR